MLLAAALMSVVALVSVGPGLASHRADSSSPSSWRTRPRRLPGGQQRQQQQPQQPSPTTGVVLATDFGAVGDGVHDDTAGLQAAIEHARNRSTLLRFPGGKYRITSYLDWGRWNAIAIVGEEPGDTGISGGAGLVQIVADRIRGTAHDFTGCGYGYVEGIAFVGSCSGAMVLNGRTSSPGPNYGSDLIFRRCNFGGAPRGAFVDHMGEVLTFQDCRFHGHSDNGPGLVITWRADSARWNVTAPSGRNLTKGVSVTQYRLYGGEFTGDNGGMIVLDMEGAPTNGGDFSAFGTYFATSGDHIAAVEIAGAWNNLILDGSRDEETDMPAHVSRGFVKLVRGASLRDFRIHGYGDADEGGPVVRGSGNLTAGTIVTGAGGGIELTGDVSAVDYRSADRVSLRVEGDVVRSSFRQGGLRQDMSMEINVTGRLEIEDGRGGVLTHQQELYGHGQSSTWSCDDAGSGGLYLAAFAGDQILLHCSIAGGLAAMSVSSHHDAAKLTGIKGVGKLEIVAHGQSKSIGGDVQATMMGTGDFFTVRRVAA